MTACVHSVHGRFFVENTGFLFFMGGIFMGHRYIV